MDLGLLDRHFYVTGVSRGVGLAIARMLLEEGATVSGCARSGEGLASARKLLGPDRARRAHFEICEVGDADALAAAVEQAAARAGRLDGVVACAGEGTGGTVLGTSNEVWTGQLELKVLSVLNLVRPAQAWLERADAPVICLINGVTAHHPEADMAAVSAARAAVANLGRSLAEELAGRIRVCTVNLGAIGTGRQTARWQAANTDPAEPQSFAQWERTEVERRGILSGRFGTPQEVADLVAFVLSPRAGYLTGVSIDVSGGSRGRP